MEDSQRVILETVRDMVAAGDLPQAVATVGNLHSADAAEILSNLEMEQETSILVEMEARSAARALLEMDEGHQVEVAENLRAGELYELLSEMPVDEAVDLLGDIPGDQRRILMRLFGREEAGELEELLAYGDESAGGLMTTEYVSVPPDATADEVVEKLRAVGEEAETIYYVYVVSGDRVLRGVLSLRELIVAPVKRQVRQMMSVDLITVSPFDDQEEVAEVISKYDLLAVPVIDDEGRIMGIVTVDDVMDVLDEEAQEDILKFAGAAGIEETARGGLFRNLGRRMPWFLVALLVEILIAGGILKLYTPVMEKFMVLVFFIPLLVTMGGNIATQSSTIMAQSLAYGRPMSAGTLRSLTGEVGWGVLVGVVTGGIVTGLSLLLNLGASIGLVVGISLALTVVAASLVGCAMPVTFKALRRDPSSVSGPLIGTVMDVLSLAVYLVIGTALI